ncbi:polysaccharide biosynthesis C-terminal domain-containing protein [Candidatus Saccharibacteria bacterium]|nr:polysaccharide biosynthesis C-terminal domain-containing protein [Candidatus Saccharibacteria bacterium]MBQ3476303.1 polysaccharide biosynthesis C-terminal domain-containing protein [Candidatus Saccharibacteria bacterium]MBQ3641606.1 polysaccharide biosynthesis C-terminal domain-containing protein [bacterium]
MRSKKAIYNIITNLALQAVAIIYGFIIPKIIIDYFGSDVNGLVSSITQFLAYIALLESGFGPVVKATLYKPLAKKDNSTIANILKASEKFFRRIALIFVLYIIVLCFVFPFIAKADFDIVFTVSLVLIIGISTFAEYYFGMTYRLFLQAEQKTYIISIIQIVTYILSVIAVVIMAVAGCGILVIKLVTALIFIMRPLAQNYYVKHKYKINIKEASGNYKIKQKWDGLAQHIAAVIHNNTDVTILTIFTTLAEVSVYSVYYLVIAGIKKIVQSFNNGLDASFGDMIAKKEDDNLRKKFSSYELLYTIITTIIFVTTILLITPFISIYTKGVNDADYYRPVFGCLLVISEYIWAIRLPYSSITLAAGHFRETRKGAWVEALTNIIISLILVPKFGIVGVTVGTIVAMLIRTIEFTYHANKYILKRSILESVAKITLSVMSVVIVSVIFCFVKLPTPDGYLSWMVNAMVVLAVACIVTFALYYAAYGKDLKKILKRGVKLIKRKK